MIDVTACGKTNRLSIAEKCNGFVMLLKGNACEGAFPLATSIIIVLYDASIVSGDFPCV